MYRETVSKVVGADDGLVLFCGVAVGFEKAGVPRLRTGAGGHYRNSELHRSVTR